ncbi:3-methyl-2-oxobutanoate hydroxymethyltransferase [Intrasporangium mesophilum]
MNGPFGSADRMTIQRLQTMKADGAKSVCVVAWDHPMARIADRAGVDLVSVGDSVGVNLWGHRNPFEVTLDEMLVVAKAVRRGVSRALVSCDFPYGPLQSGAGVDTAVRLVKEAGVDLVKLDGASDYPEVVEAVTRAGVPVFGQLGITPQTALRHGVDYSSQSTAQVPDGLLEDIVAQARRLESAGAALLDFTNSGPVVGPAVVGAVSIPVLGGMGGGPWLDGRIRMAAAAVGYAARWVDEEPDTYANVARIAHDALSDLVSDVREGRQIRGGIPVGDPPTASTTEGTHGVRRA